MWTGVLVLLEPEETFKTGNMKTGMTKKFFSLLAPHKSVMLQAVFGALIYSILGLSTSIYVGKITDYVLVDKISICLISWELSCWSSCYCGLLSEQ